MKVKRSFLFSFLIAIAVCVWMFSGQFTVPSSVESESSTIEIQPVKVLTEDLHASQVTVDIVVQGQLEPERRLEIRAETGGQVSSILVTKGTKVSVGQILIKLAEDDRPARVAQARAELAREELNLEGAERLFARKMQSESEVKLAAASVAASLAALKLAQIDLSRINVIAPFSGVLESVDVELGSLLDRGDPILELIDDSHLKAVGYVPQQSVALLKVGQQVTVVLLDGRKASATLQFISNVAESSTRSFRVEAIITNSETRMTAGVTAELSIEVGEENGHFISPAVLTLDANGSVGVKLVTAEKMVKFYPINLIRTETAGVWVSGLPESVSIITRGQNFVSEGQVVEAVNGS